MEFACPPCLPPAKQKHGAGVATLNRPEVTAVFLSVRPFWFFCFVLLLISADICGVHFCRDPESADTKFCCFCFICDFELANTFVWTFGGAVSQFGRIKVHLSILFYSFLTQTVVTSQHSRIGCNQPNIIGLKTSFPQLSDVTSELKSGV